MRPCHPSSWATLPCPLGLTKVPELHLSRASVLTSGGRGALPEQHLSFPGARLGSAGCWWPYHGILKRLLVLKQEAKDCHLGSRGGGVPLCDSMRATCLHQLVTPLCPTHLRERNCLCLPWCSAFTHSLWPFHGFPLELCVRTLKGTAS